MKLTNAITKAREEDNRVPVTSGQFSGHSNVEIVVLPFTDTKDETDYLLLSRLMEFFSICSEKSEVFVVQVRENTECSFGELYDNDSDVFDEKVCEQVEEAKIWIEKNGYNYGAEDSGVIDDPEQFVQNVIEQHNL